MDVRASSDATVEKKVMMTVVMLVDIWNCKNLRIALLTQQSHMMMFAIKERLSFVRRISKASFTTSVPALDTRRKADGHTTRPDCDCYLFKLHSRSTLVYCSGNIIHVSI